jgi:hypothetical protein
MGNFATKASAVSRDDREQNGYAEYAVIEARKSAALNRLTRSLLARALSFFHRGSVWCVEDVRKYFLTIPESRLTFGAALPSVKFESSRAHHSCLNTDHFTWQILQLLADAKAAPPGLWHAPHDVFALSAGLCIPALKLIAASDCGNNLS